jgi:Tfp pilus assembly protein PilW
VSLVVLVVGAILSSLYSAQRSERYASDRSAALDEMRNAMARFTKDLRQADGLEEGATSSNLEADTYVNGVAARVEYAAAGGVLTRAVNGGSAEILINRITEDTVFTFEPDATSAEVVKITLVVAPVSSPDTTIELYSEVRMRNRGTT